jgi:hypothetical protein
VEVRLSLLLVFCCRGGGGVLGGTLLGPEGSTRRLVGLVSLECPGLSGVAVVVVSGGWWGLLFEICIVDASILISLFCSCC